MAEGLARQYFGSDVLVQSAGSSPSRVNPFAITALKELKIDASTHTSKSVQDIDLSTVDLVITLCAEEVCPVLHLSTQRLHWPIEDPDRKHETLSDDQRLNYFRIARDEINTHLRQLNAHRE